MRAPWAKSGQYLHGWTEFLEIVSRPILDLDVVVCSVWPRRECLSVWPCNPIGHKENAVFA